MRCFVKLLTAPAGLAFLVLTLLSMMVLSATVSAQQTSPVVQSPLQMLPSLTTKPQQESTDVVISEERLNEQNLQFQASQVRQWEENAKRWNLTAEDWGRYVELMKGPRGFWSPNLDPLTALGVEARSENERVRLAQIQVRMEAERADRELAYQRTYDAVFESVYANMLPIAPLQDRASSSPPRVALFVKPDCPDCDRKAQMLQDDKAAFDVYMLGTGGKDSVIRDWAKKVGISAKLVADRTITLNHDNGTLGSIGGSADDKLPALYQMVEGTGLWVPSE
jgi:integrating conjugative element protein (TIGR03759 family)